MKKYGKIIIIVLAALLFLQTCSKCSSKQEHEFYKVEQKKVQDSLQSLIKAKELEVVKKDSTIIELRSALEAVEKSSEKTIKMLNDNTKYIVNKLKEKE